MKFKLFDVADSIAIESNLFIVYLLLDTITEDDIVIYNKLLEERVVVCD